MTKKKLDVDGMSEPPKMDLESRIMYLKEFLKSESGQLIAEILTNYKAECIKARVGRTETARKRSDFTENMVEDVVMYAHYEEAADDILARIQNCVIVEE